eukprot:7379390-Prymnesium_polylepis.3
MDDYARQERGAFLTRDGPELTSRGGCAKASVPSWRHRGAGLAHPLGPKEARASVAAPLHAL